MRYEITPPTVKSAYTKQFLRTNDIPPVDYNDLQSFKEFAERRNEQLRELLGDPPEDIKKSETQ